MSVPSIAVYCGSASGSNPAFAREAFALGAAIAESGARLVYGGGSLGLMGAVADGALSRNGAVTGVITKQLVGKELAHPRVADMRIVDTMHERKMQMATIADAFVSLPGGFGTLDELFEVLAWAQLKLHEKPIALLDTEGYFTGMLAFLDHAQGHGFLRLSHREYLMVQQKPDRLVRGVVERLTSSGRAVSRV
ncbi:MAG: TIGR00730 family Rossman fold protein [Phycisphaerales bacterium]|nr:TIGR00730 family Rossman fold protein [Phycisphaerales bacterium]